MSVTLEDVRYISELARLRLDPDEAEAIRGDLNRILEYMETLGQADTEGVEPLEHVMEIALSARADEPQPPLAHEQAMRNAPDADSDYFRVPKVLE